MDDREVIRMALFKIADAAKRVAQLATSARSPSVRDQLSELGRRLQKYEQQVRDLETPAERSRSKRASAAVGAWTVA
jgi:hypothetical protein